MTEKMTALIGDGWTMTLERSPGRGQELNTTRVADAFAAVAGILGRPRPWKLETAVPPTKGR